MDQPTTFRAGDSVTWTASLPDYPASAGWVLKFRLLSSSAPATEIVTVADGDDFVVDQTAADTASWPPGKATLVKIVEKGNKRITLDAPVVTILANLETSTSFDGRSRNEKALDDAEAALADYLAAGQMHVAEYEVAGRTMKFRTVQEIRDFIALCRRAVNRDRAALALLNGTPPPGRIYYRG